jgi:nucleotide-binding universal stress UspA family protein
MRKVLLVAEGTVLSKESLMCAVNLCKRTSAALLVVNVVDCPREHTYWADVHKRLVRERLDEAARNIDPLLEAARAQGIEVELVREAGDPDALLARLARSEGSMLAALVSRETPAPVRAGIPHSYADPIRQLFERLQGLFGCPLVEVKARK